MRRTGTGIPGTVSTPKDRRECTAETVLPLLTSTQRHRAPKVASGHKPTRVGSGSTTTPSREVFRTRCLAADQRAYSRFELPHISGGAPADEGRSPALARVALAGEDSLCAALRISSHS